MCLSAICTVFFDQAVSSEQSGAAKHLGRSVAFWADGKNQSMCGNAQKH